MDTYNDSELLYSAVDRCQCGAGLAYPLNSKAALELRAWVCSKVLHGEVSEEGHDRFDFRFWKIREETSINNRGGHSTRPPGSVALTVGFATCPKCGREWQSDPYNACGLGHHWFSGPCTDCGYAVGAAGSWSTSDGDPIEHRYRDVVVAS